ncbi:MAG: DegT/DnrJ/EryC1/StrS family aminotransferase [Candidatus Omnitrophota bacterium]
MKVPYFDLSRSHQRFVAEAQAAFDHILKSGAYILGPALKELEAEFASYIGTKHALGVGSGTDALIFALRALDIKKGDEVIVPSFTFTATALAVLHVGATPVFADVLPETFNLAPESVVQAVTPKTRAIIPVHLFGQCADMTALMALAKRMKLKVVEDACQAHGAMWNKVMAGAFGNAGCFSFYPTKNLGGVGDGGMVTTSDEEILKRIIQYRNLGKGIEDPFVHDEIGWTSRLDSLQAAFLSIKLKFLDELNRERRAVAAMYHKKLAKTPLILPREVPGAYHVYHLYVVRVPCGKRNALKESLAAKGIPTMVHYATPVHGQPIMKKFMTRKMKLPVTDTLCEEVLTLPLFPGMTEPEVGAVSVAIQQFYGR